MTTNTPFISTAAAVALSICFAGTLHAELNLSSSDIESYRTIVNDLADPSMEGRGIGTSGLERARDYIVDRFKALGLKPAFAEGTHNGFTQPFDANAGVKLKEHSLAVTVGETTEKAKGYSVMGFSPNKAFSGDVVFVGYSIVDKERKYNSFEGADTDALNGKVVIAFRYEPQDEKGKSLWTKEGGGQFGQWTGNSDLTKKAKWSAERGAVAFLFVNPPTQPTKSLKATAHSTGAAIKIPAMHISMDLFKRILKKAGVEDADSEVVSLQKRANKGGGIVKFGDLTITGNVKLERRKVRVHNVGAVLPGNGPLKDEVIVVGAHYDHLGFGGAGSRDPKSGKKIHHGADDNASGTAGLMMLAEWYAGRARTKENHRTIVFAAFTGEESGLLGSRHMVKNLKDARLDPENIVAMLNMDMIGRLNEDKIYVMGVGSGKQWKSLVNEASKDMAFELKTTESGTGPSDHTSFYMQRIPVLHFFTGTHKDYHKPSDTADKVNNEGAVKVLTLMDRILSRLWTDPERVAFQKTKARPHMGGTPRGSGAYLGIVPDYATIEGDQGCGLDGVSPGSPAEKAGLKSGDLIVQWDKIKVGNVYDLMKGLRSVKPRQKVKLKVKRGNKVIDVDVVMGSR